MTLAMNPNDVPEECECGHEESDHELESVTAYMTEPPLLICGFCGCTEFIPKDDKYYEDERDEARLARWEESRY